MTKILTNIFLLSANYLPFEHVYRTWPRPIYFQQQITQRRYTMCTQKYTLNLVYRQCECSLSPVRIHALLLLFFASRFQNFKALAFCLFHKLFTHVFRENSFWRHKANRRQPLLAYSSNIYFFSLILIVL